MLPSHAQQHPLGPAHAPGIENSRDESLRASRDEATFHQSLLLWGRLCPVAPTAVGRSWQRVSVGYDPGLNMLKGLFHKPDVGALARLADSRMACSVRRLGSGSSLRTARGSHAPVRMRGPTLG